MRWRFRKKCELFNEGFGKLRFFPCEKRPGRLVEVSLSQCVTCRGQKERLSGRADKSPEDGEGRAPRAGCPGTRHTCVRTSTRLCRTAAAAGPRRARRRAARRTPRQRFNDARDSNSPQGSPTSVFDLLLKLSRVFAFAKTRSIFHKSCCFFSVPTNQSSFTHYRRLKFPFPFLHNTKIILVTFNFSVLYNRSTSQQ